MSKHTPGPWMISKVGVGNVVGPDGRRLVANTAGRQTYIDPEDTDAENDANARLIAAAPDLYEALAEIIRVTGGCLGCGNCMMCDAREALVKARGEVTSDGE